MVINPDTPNNMLLNVSRKHAIWIDIKYKFSFMINKICTNAVYTNI